MQRLSHRDTKAVFRFLYEIYRLQTFEDFTANLVRGLGAVVRADLIGVLENRTNEKGAFYTFAPEGVATEKTHRTWEYVGHEHPVLAHYARTQDTGYWKMSDFVSTGAYHGSALYNELYRGMGVEDAIVSVFASRRGDLAAVALHRDRRTFGERDRAVLNVLQPHVIQAWRNAHLAFARYSQLDVDRFAEAVDSGVVCLDSSERVRSMTALARSMLAEYFGPEYIGGHHLPDLIARWARSVKRQFVPEAVPVPVAPLVIERQESRLIVRFLLGGECDWLLLQAQRPARELVCGHDLDLTQREMEILTWVAKGKTNKEIGVILRASPRTVQKHLEHIFLKLGVETRTAAAAALVARDPSDSGT